MCYRGLTALLLVVVVLTAVTLLRPWLDPDVRPSIEQLPGITVHGLNRQAIDFAALQGRPLLVTFWSITCASCVKEIPHLVELYERHTRDGLAIVGVSSPQDLPHRVVEFVREYGIPYPVALDVEARAQKAFGGVFVTPTTFLFAADGELVFKTVGPFDKDQVEQLVIKLLSRQGGEEAGPAAHSTRQEQR